MDGHGQVGPEKPDYLRDLQLVANLLEAERVVHLGFAALMSRWGILLIPKAAPINVGQAMRGIGPYIIDGQQIAGDSSSATFEVDFGGYRVGPNNYTTVVITEGHRLGQHTFAVRTWHSPGYVGSKLWGAEYNPVDALAIAGLLNRIERLRLPPGDMSLNQLEVWEWQEYEGIERKEGHVATAARFAEITGTPYERALKFANNEEKIR